MEEKISEYRNVQIKPSELNKDRIAIVSSGPAGLTIAVTLAVEVIRLPCLKPTRK